MRVVASLQGAMSIILPYDTQTHFTNFTRTQPQSIWGCRQISNLQEASSKVVNRSNHLKQFPILHLFQSKSVHLRLRKFNQKCKREEYIDLYCTTRYVKRFKNI
jgi:hypothetical protein